MYRCGIDYDTEKGWLKYLRLVQRKILIVRNESKG